MITLTIRPVRRDGRDDPNGRYEARLGDRLLCVSREPFFAAARVLLAEGVPPKTPIELRRESSPDVVAFRATVGAAAKLTVRENSQEGPKLVRWKASPFGDVPAARAPADPAPMSGSPENENSPQGGDQGG